MQADDKQDRKVQDNIYGLIDFQQKIWKFIDTIEFQKLKYIKQLGTLYQVFPGATHSRFQHSLGTGHLAKTFLQNLIKNHQNIYTNEEQKKQALFTVTLAGIMHDVGHGPFSHTFDNGVIKTLVQKVNPNEKIVKWQHQLGSEIIFRSIAKRLGKRIITDDQIQRVVKLICQQVNEKDERPWQFQLISNKITGIDVDKLDYFRRDSYYLGAKGIQINHQLLMRQARLIKNDKGKYTICYPLKYALQVNKIFSTRYELYRTYYLNNKAKGIQFMILDALNLVQPIFKFNDICRQIRKGQQYLQKYINLTDSLLERIQLFDQQNVLFKQNQKLLKDLQDAKKLLICIKTRKIYKFVRQVYTTISEQNFNSDKQTKLKEILSVENIKKYIVKQTGDQKLQNLFHIAITDIGYGLKDKNPLNQVNFFRKQLKLKSIIPKNQLKAQNISILYTNSFAQRHAKLYVKNQVPEAQIRLINDNFHKYFAEKITQNNEGLKQNDKNIILVNHVNFGRTYYYRGETANLEQLQQLQIINNQNIDLPRRN